MKSARIALIGDRSEAVAAHRGIELSMELAGDLMGCGMEPLWLDTAKCEEASFEGFDALWCVPGRPYVSMAGALRAIRYARENHLPFLGSCGGFQHALIEYARNVRGWIDADHAETNAEGSLLLVSRLACSLAEGQGRVVFADGSRIGEIYGAADARE